MRKIAKAIDTAPNASAESTSELLSAKRPMPKNSASVQNTRIAISTQETGGLAGSLYLHCDPTASHYLKVLLDAIFGPENFRSDIIWKRQTAHSDATTKFASLNDNLLMYGKSREAIFNVVREPLSDEYVKKFYKFHDTDGRLYQLDNIAAPEGGGMSAIRKDTGRPN